MPNFRAVDDEASSRGSRWLEHVRSLRVRTWVLLVVLAVVVNPLTVLWLSSATLSVQVAGSGSMEPTIPVGHWYVLNQMAYGESDPQRGDIVGLTAPYRGEKLGLTKRVVGLPGEKVQLYGGLVYINDVPLEEPYLDQPAATWDDWPVYLGGDEYYVLGDNRRNSLDSRRIGPIQRSAIESRMGASGPGFRSGVLSAIVVVELLELPTLMVLLSMGSVSAASFLVSRRRHNQWWAIPAFVGWGVWFALLWVGLRRRSSEEVQRKVGQASPSVGESGLEQPVAALPVGLRDVLLTQVMVLFAFNSLLTAFGIPVLYASGGAVAFMALCLALGAMFDNLRMVLGILLWQSMICVFAVAAGEILGLESRQAATLGAITVGTPMVVNNIAWRLLGARPDADVRQNLVVVLIGQFIWFGAATVYVPLERPLMALIFGIAALALLVDQLRPRTASAPFVAVLGTLGVASILVGEPWLMATQFALPFLMFLFAVREIEQVKLRRALAGEELPLQPAT